MTNTNLAEALRVLLKRIRTGYDGLPQGHGIKHAEEALAAHDAEQAALRELECPPDPETVERDQAAQAVPAGMVRCPRCWEMVTAPAAPAPEAQADTVDAQRWRTFISLPYATRAEWAANLSMAPVLTQWVDEAAKEQKE